MCHKIDIDKQKIFLEKAIKLHGDNYSFEKSVYVKSSEKLIVTCFKHGDFIITPMKLLDRSQGCRLCYEEKYFKCPRTIEEFLKVTKEKFGDNLEYPNLVIPKNIKKTKIKIYCKKHDNLFEQTYGTHLVSKYGCDFCSQENKISGILIPKDELINRLNKKYNNKFTINLDGYINKDSYIDVKCPHHGTEKVKVRTLLDTTYFCEGCYFKETVIDVIYKKFDEKFKIITEGIFNVTDEIEVYCETHGKFKTKIKQLLRNKYGCDECKTNSLYGVEEFLKKVVKKFKNKYTYNLDSFVNMDSEIMVKCPEHGWFNVTAKNHIKSTYGCDSCSKSGRGLKKRLDYDKYIVYVTKLHDNIYDYSKVVLTTAHEKITIICKEHGEFEQTANNHKRGQKCPQCDISKGEYEVGKILNGNGFKFTKEKTFDKCKYKNILFFDFYLPKYNLVIEYDGEQHYKSISWFGGDEALRLQKERDNVKNNFCQEENINLLRIKYDNKDIEKTILNKIKEIGVIT